MTACAGSPCRSCSSPEVGTIDTCGRYRAPDAFAPGLTELVIEAADWQLPDGCADCCPYAAVTLTPRPP